MLLGIYSWARLLWCAVAVYKVVLAGQEQSGNGAGAEQGMHSAQTILVSLGTQQGALTEQLPTLEDCSRG